VATTHQHSLPEPAIGGRNSAALCVIADIGAATTPKTDNEADT
jgi:hypothetical protein